MPSEVNGETNPPSLYPAEGLENGAEMDVNERLRRARLAAGYESARSAARAFGWNEETYKSHENGVRGLKPAVARRYADAFRIKVAWLLLGEGEGPQEGPRGERAMKAPLSAELPLVTQPPFSPIMAKARESDENSYLPVYGSVVESEQGRGDLVDFSDVVARLPPPRSVTGVTKAFGMYVVGDTCSPMFRPGDLVWTNPGKPLTKGCGVVVVFADNTAMVRLFVRRDTAGVELEQLQPAGKIRVPRAKIAGIYRIVTTDHA